MRLSERVRVGVIGTSLHTQTTHLANLKSHRRADVAAICGRDQRRAHDVANRYGIPLVFADYRELIEKARPDLLVIVAPDDLHYRIAMDAFDAGLHVLCEKPLALTAREARGMFERAEQARVKHMTFFSWRWPPAQRYVGRLIKQGYVGRCFDCQLHFLHGLGRQKQYEWRFDRQRSAGALGDLGSHMIDLARCYAGEVSRVSANLATFVDRPGPDGAPLDSANDSALLALRFASGAQGTIQVSTVAHVADREVEQTIIVHGEEGSLEARYSSLGTEVRGARLDEAAWRTLPMPDDVWGDTDRRDPLGVFRTLSVGDRLMIDAILDDRPVSPNFYDGMKVQEVIDAAIESDRTGEWISLA